MLGDHETSLLNQVVAERDTLRAQNEQLWQIIRQQDADITLLRAQLENSKQQLELERTKVKQIRDAPKTQPEPQRTMKPQVTVAPVTVENETHVPEPAKEPHRTPSRKSVSFASPVFLEQVLDKQDADNTDEAKAQPAPAPSKHSRTSSRNHHHHRTHHTNSSVSNENFGFCPEIPADALPVQHVPADPALLNITPVEETPTARLEPVETAPRTPPERSSSHEQREGEVTTSTKEPEPQQLTAPIEDTSTTITNETTQQDPAPTTVEKSKGPSVRQSSIPLAPRPTRLVPTLKQDRLRILLERLTSQTLFIDVISSAVRLNQKNKEYTVYIIAVYTQDPSQSSSPDNESMERLELWRIEKRYSDLLELHERIKNGMGRDMMMRYGLGKQPPQKTLFTSHSGLAPSKSDQRRSVLERYINSVVVATYAHYKESPISSNVRSLL